MAAAVAAAAQDMTPLEPMVCFLFILFLLLLQYYFFLGLLNTSKWQWAEAAAAAAQDATHLETLVCFFSKFHLFFITLIFCFLLLLQYYFFLGLLNTSKWQWAETAAAAA